MASLVSKSGSRRRVINPRAAVLLAVVLVAGSTGMRMLHDRQFGRTVAFIRETAFRSLSREDYAAARQQLSHYLSLNPGDIEARERLSWVLTERIGTQQALQQAFRQNEVMLRKGFGDDALRLRQARVAVKLDMMSEADAHLKLLQASQADNSEVWYLSGVSARATRDPSRAAACLQRAIRCPQSMPEAWELLAELATAESPPELQPEFLMNEMIRRCPSATGHEIRARYLLSQGRKAEAISDLWQALAERPDELTVNAMLGRCLESLESASSRTPARRSETSENLTKAIVHFRAQSSRWPHSPEFRLYLADVLMKSNDQAAAIRTLEEGIQKTPRAFVLHQTLIEYLTATDEPGRARRILEGLLPGSLDRGTANYCLGRILIAEQKWTEAASVLVNALAFAKKDSAVFSSAQLSLAIARSYTGEHGASMEGFRAAVAANPESISARLGMAAAWIQSGQTQLAIAEYRQLVGVAGVAGYLADLLIRKNLELPPSARNWAEIDALLCDDKPQIADPVQRILLRADRLFAAGQVVAAMRTLETAGGQSPDRPEITAALSRLHGQ